MKTRRFGRLGWQVSPIGYGMWGMGDWTGSDDERSFASLVRAVELGCNFFDTAWAYGDGRSEALLGRLVRAVPERRLYTATKIPPKNGEWPARRDATLDVVFPPDHIEEYVASSLANAGLESFDLVQFHVWNDVWVEDLRWSETMEKLSARGLVGGVGISLNRWEPENALSTVRSGLVDSVQVVYNIFDQNPEDELFTACAEMDVAVIARVPFDEGTLTGKLTRESTWPEGDWRNHYFRPPNLEASVERAEALAPLVPEDQTMAEMALRFILGHPAVSTVIPGMRKLEHVEANMASGERGPLDEELMRRLRAHRWERRPETWPP